MKKIFKTNWTINEMCLSSLVENDGKNILRQTTFTLEDSPERHSSFGQLLVQAVDEGLCALGESSRQAVYGCLESAFCIQRDDIPQKISEFSNALEKLFGDSARLLEIQIMKKLYKKVGDIAEYYPEKEDITFTEYVAAAELSSRSK